MKFLCVFGTRPEAIKMAPVVEELRRRPGCEVVTCVTGQHREMLDQVLNIFRLRPDFDLNLMRPNQDLTDLTANTLVALRTVFEQVRPDRVLVQGDTTTTFAASLASFYARIPIAHVEAGLRTYDFSAPWPEEMNRVLTTSIADLHFAPTKEARENLLRQLVPADNIYVTGNTVIDALLAVVARLEADESLADQMRDRFRFLDSTKRLILVTGHRRENFGVKFEQVCQALRDSLLAHDDVELIYPVHLNPNVREPVNRILGDEAEDLKERVHLIEPVDYIPFVYLLRRAYLIVTDSGGVQEEAPGLGKPVLVTRDTTERPEAVSAGTVLLVGTEQDRIFRELDRLLEDRAHYDSMTKAHNPYGDGTAARQIADVLEERAGSH